MAIFTLSSVVRGYHVYRDIWDAQVGEVLPCIRETTNYHDPHAVAVSKDNTVVGHVPRRISTLCSLFILRGGTISCQVDGRRQYSRDLPQGGMEIPCTLIFTAGEKVLIDRIKILFQEISEIQVAADLSVEQEGSDSSPNPKKRKLNLSVNEQRNAIESSTLNDIWVCLDTRILLKMSEREVILQNMKLNDLVINFAQILLKRQFPLINGLFSTLLLTTTSQFIGWKENFLQICHCQGMDHWVTVSTKGCSDGEVMIYDSSYSDVNPSVASAIERLFSTHPLTFKMAVVGKQEGAIDCGVLAIANATAIAFRDSVTHLPKFDQKRIRPHLASCLEMKSFNEFPEIFS